MGRRRNLNFTSLFSKFKDPTTQTSSSTKYSSSPSSSSSSWPWPSCNTHPKTNSFRCDDIYKTTNSIYFNSTHSSFTNSSHCEETSSSTQSNEDDSESIIRGLRSNDRLFFEPGGDSSSLLAQGQNGSSPFKESLVLAIESEDPYSDFRRSMEEMVAAYGIKEWECFEELLSWYLRANGKKNHGFIVGAFVDLLAGFGLNKEETENNEKSGGVCFCCDDDSMSSISFEIEEVEEGSASC